MNLVEASSTADAVRFGQFRVPARRACRRRERVVLGIRPESFEDAASAPGLPTIDVRVEVVEELGSETHVFFHVDAPPITAEMLESASEAGFLTDERRALHRPGRRRRRRSRRRDASTLGVDAARFHFFDPDTGARLDRRTGGRRSPGAQS